MRLVTLSEPFESFGEGLYQNFRNKTIFTSEKSVMNLYDQGNISELEVNILKFIFKAKFSTSDQIIRFLNPTDDFEMKEIVAKLKGLTKQKLINCFSLSDDKEAQFDFSNDVQVIYCLDVGGSQLLNHLLNDMDLFDWIVYDNIQNSEIIAQRLISNEIFIASNNQLSNMIEFRYNPETRGAANQGFKLVRPSFHIVTKDEGGESSKMFFLGESVTFEEYLNGNLREKISRLQSLVETGAFKRNYMDKVDIPPSILFICPAAKKDTELILETIANSGLKNCYVTSINKLKERPISKAFATFEMLDAGEGPKLSISGLNMQF